MRSVGLHELDLGMSPVSMTVVAALVSGVDRAHEVEVLGQRLRLQTGGFEGFPAIDVKLDPGDFPVADGP
jgi:hypothetical protein